MAKEMPPKNFPIDDEGNKICAKCNSVSGCTRPVMDQHNSNLRSELFEVEQLYTFENMTSWIENAQKNQRCIWGVHKAITKDDALQFNDWFKRPENKGFQPYGSTFVMSIVKELLHSLYLKSYKNDKIKKGAGQKLTTKQKNDLLYQINGVERAYMDMDGAEVFHFLVDCERDSKRCNERREYEGKNHQHPYELEGTEIDKETYAEVADLRKKCIDLGLDPATGPQRDIEKTIKILQKRIDDQTNQKALAAASRKKNEERSDVIKENKSTVKVVAGDQLSKHMGNACSANDITKVLSLIKRGANANIETPRGMRPLLVVIVNNGNPDQISKVIKGGAYINACNRIGLTALMLACRLRDTRLTHLLLQQGADEVASEGRYGQGRTALHYCAIHSAEDEAQALYDYIKEGADEDPVRMKRFIDFQDKNGDSPLMVAARNRNGLMCYNLLKMGADPKVMNAQKRNAAYIAREYSYGALADFLDTKVSSGVASIETFSDLQFEKVQRFGGLKLMELIQQYCNKILKLLQGRNNVTILMCPSRIQEFADMYGDHEKHQLVNRYFFFILMQQTNNADTTAMIDSMKRIVEDIVKVVREGNVYPSAEALEKPLPWTALMCAVTINDARSMRLICHEGADPNYQNRHGMTALMLAAQLNNIEAICELLLLGSDVNVVDNEGYNAYAYAISLPYAKPLQRSASNVLTDGDNEATKRYTADEVLKMAVTLTPVEIKVRVKANLKKCTAVEIKREMGRLKLLEKNGLSKVKTDDDVHHSAASSHWRIDPEASLSLFGEDCYGETNKKISVMDAVSKIREQDKRKGEKPRCPICTLAIPCKHFKKESLANDYARKKEREELLAIEKKKNKAKLKKYEEDEDEDEDEDSGRHGRKERSNALYEKEDSNDVSENEHLRMQLEIEKERAQILADRLEKEENETDGLNNLPPRTPVKVKLRRQLHEEQQKSKELAMKLEVKKNEREKENKKKSKAKDYEENAKKNSTNTHPHTPVTSKLLRELEDEKQKAIDLAEELDRVKNGEHVPKTPENSERAQVRRELENEKDRIKSLESALDKTKKRIQEDANSPLKKKKGKRFDDDDKSAKKNKSSSSKNSKSKGNSSKYVVDSDEEEEEEEDEEGLVMSSKSKSSKLRKKVEEERRKKEEEIRRKEEKKKAQEKARKEEEKRKKKEEAEKKKARELERKRKEAEKARLKEEARKQKEKEAKQRKKEEEQARLLAKQAKEKAERLKREQKAQDAKIKKEREKMKVKLMELQTRLNKKEIDDTKKHKKSKDKKSLEKSASEYRKMKKEMEAISNKLNKTSRRANDAENRLEEMVQLMSIKKEIEDHNSKIAEATTRKSTLAKKLLNHMGDAVLYSEAGFSDDAHQYMNNNKSDKVKQKNKHQSSTDDSIHNQKNSKSSKKSKLHEALTHSKKNNSKRAKTRRKRYETSDDESVSSESDSESASELSSSSDGSDSETETSIEDVGIQLNGSSDEDSDSDLNSVSDLETSASGNETEASGFYDSDGSRPVSRSIIKRNTGEKKYKSKKRVLKFNINNKIMHNLPKGEKKIKVSTYHAALKRPETAETEASVSSDEDSSSGEESGSGGSSSSGSEVESESEGEATEVESEVESDIEEEEEEEEDYKKLSRKNRDKMAKWMNKL